MATAVKAPPSAPADTPLGQLQMLCDPGTFRPAAQRRLQHAPRRAGDPRRRRRRGRR